nr:hypothetical protein [Chitinophaga sedimenti]
MKVPFKVCFRQRVQRKLQARNVQVFAIAGIFIQYLTERLLQRAFQAGLRLLLQGKGFVHARHLQA